MLGQFLQTKSWAPLSLPLHRLHKAWSVVGIFNPLIPKIKSSFNVSHQLHSIWWNTVLSAYHGQLKLGGLPSQLSAILNVQLSKQERVGMNEAGPIMDLAMCEDAIRTAVQKCSFSQRIRMFLDSYLADGERGPRGTCNWSAISGKLRAKVIQAFLVIPFKWPAMVDSLLPEELPTAPLSNIAHLYHHSYSMWRYLPAT